MNLYDPLPPPNHLFTQTHTSPGINSWQWRESILLCFWVKSLLICQGHSRQVASDIFRLTFYTTFLLPYSGNPWRKGCWMCLECPFADLPQNCISLGILVSVRVCLDDYSFWWKGGFQKEFLLISFPITTKIKLPPGFWCSFRYQVQLDMYLWKMREWREQIYAIAAEDLTHPSFNNGLSLATEIPITLFSNQLDQTPWPEWKVSLFQ